MIQGYHYRNPHTALPPGKYVFSNQFQNTMNQLAPIYTIPTKPVYFDHLLLHLNKTIEVVTTSGPLKGELSGVAIDHLQLTIDDFNYHINYNNVTYFVTPKK